MKFYIVCPDNGEKIYLCSLPENPYETKVKFKEGFDVDSCKTSFSLGDIKIEPEDHFYFTLFVSFFISIILMGLIGVFSIIIIIIVPFVSRAWRKNEEMEAKKYISIIKEEKT